MKKLNITEVPRRFSSDIERLEGMLDAAGELAPTAWKFLIESSLLFAAVRWEGFVHELFVAYINRDSKQFGKWLQSSIVQSVKDKRGEVVASHLRLDLPTHLTRERVQQVLDREDQNVTFKKAADLVVRAKEWLPPAAAKRFEQLSSADLAAIDMSIAVRNFLAHRSLSSSAVMNDVLASPDLDASFRRGAHRISDVGTHFCAAPGKSSTPRVNTFLTVMRTVAEKL